VRQVQQRLQLLVRDGTDVRTTVTEQQTLRADAARDELEVQQHR
jgi:hypothetical protein